MLGDGPMKDEIDALIDKYRLNDNFVRPGWQSDVAGMMAAMDIFVVTSHWEGFCIALLEAQAEGLPCVTTDVKCFKESLCPQMHQNLFPDSQPQRGAEMLVNYLHNPDSGRRIGRIGRAYVKKYDMQEITRQMEEIYAGNGRKHQ